MPDAPDREALSTRLRAGTLPNPGQAGPAKSRLESPTILQGGFGSLPASAGTARGKKRYRTGRLHSNALAAQSGSVESCCPSAPPGDTVVPWRAAGSLRGEPLVVAPLVKSRRHHSQTLPCRSCSPQAFSVRATRQPLRRHGSCRSRPARRSPRVGLESAQARPDVKRDRAARHPAAAGATPTKPRAAGGTPSGRLIRVLPRQILAELHRLTRDVLHRERNDAVGSSPPIPFTNRDGRYFTTPSTSRWS